LRGCGAIGSRRGEIMSQLIHPTDSKAFLMLAWRHGEISSRKKHACGYAYHEATRTLPAPSTTFLVQEGLTIQELPGLCRPEMVSKEASPRKWRETHQQKDHCHSSAIASPLFCCGSGHSRVCGPIFTLATSKPNIKFSCPRMLTETESLRKFFRGRGRPLSLRRVRLCGIVIMPEVFLFSACCMACGFRVGEVLKTNGFEDVDLKSRHSSTGSPREIPQRIAWFLPPCPS